MCAHRVEELVPDSPHWIKRIHRSLRNHGDAAEADCWHIRLGNAGDIGVTIEHDAPANNAPRRFDHSQERERDGRFPATRLSDQTKPLSLAQRKGDAVDSPDYSSPGLKLHEKVANT